MANFVALTPPVGQGTWGPVPVLVPAGFDFPITPGGASFEEIGYPTLNAPIRVLILKKYPGTILPNPDLEDGLSPQLLIVLRLLGEAN